MPRVVHDPSVAAPTMITINLSSAFERRSVEQSLDAVFHHGDVEVQKEANWFVRQLDFG
jgi:hypothetical protein